MEFLGNYKILTPLSNKNAGSCQWCFGEKNGKVYFIKEFEDPKHPFADTTSSPEKIRKKQMECDRFEMLKIKAYHIINSCSDGNAVPVTEFFRIGGRYYMAMPRILSEEISVKDIARMSVQEKCRICMIIAHTLACIHRGSYVHSDIKDTNVLFCRTVNGNLTAKLIDYDSGFFEDHPPKCGEEIAGDANYFSPEACLVMGEETAPLTCKMDVFALGVLFHQYFSGEYPMFDDAYSCAGEAVAYGENLGISPGIPTDIGYYIKQMLIAEPEKRPASKDVYTFFFEYLYPDREPNIIPDGFWGDIPGKHGMNQVKRI